MATAMLLQYFDFRMDDPNYRLAINSTLTVKPKDLFIHASLRKGIDSIRLDSMMAGSTPGTVHVPEASKTIKITTSRKPLSVYFGGNTGTCESLAQTIAQSSASHGFKAIVKPLDEASNNLPKDHPVIIITASYEGEPPDNAIKFFSWLQNLKGKPLEGVQYSVFGCGNRRWSHFHHNVQLILVLQAIGRTHSSEYRPL